MRKTIFSAFLLSALAAAPAAAVDAVPVSLRGSPASMKRQNAVAKENDLSFVRTRAQMRAMERQGRLVRLPGNADYTFARGVSGPVARPSVRVFVERLASQYRDACGERLVITSLTRPSSNQPGNAHPLSVHPAGMAVDLRISKKASCRGWLESTLLSLEARGLLDVTREARPPHYHVAVFPDAYRAYVERLAEREEEAVGTERADEESAEAEADTREALLREIEEVESLLPAAAPPVAAAGVASSFVASSASTESTEDEPGNKGLPIAIGVAAAVYTLVRERARRREG